MEMSEYRELPIEDFPTCCLCCKHSTDHHSFCVIREMWMSHHGICEAFRRRKEW